MMLMRSILFGLFLISPISVFSSVLPTDAQVQLNKIGGKLTVDFVVAQAAGVSDSFRAVSSEMYQIPEYEYLGSIPTDFVFYGSGGQTNDKRVNDSSINGKSYKELIGQTYKVGGRTYFLTGTAFSVEFEQNYTKTESDVTFLGASTEIDGYESNLTFQVSQSLMKDAFGYGTIKGIQAGRLASESAVNRFKGNVSDWTTDLVDQFYNAWRLQQQVFAARAGFARRQKLLQTTKLKLQRGTAERPDILQTDSAVLASEIQVKMMEQNLSTIWRELVVQLKLPIEWINVDPTLIPLELDEPHFKALQLCGPKERFNNPPSENFRLKEYKLAAESAELSADKAENALLPDVKLVGQYFANGLDDESGTKSNDDALEMKDKGWFVGASLEFPLGRFQQKAELSRALANKYRAEALSSMESSRLKTDWINLCHDLYRLRESVEFRRKASSNQNERAKLEDQRFSVGRSGVLQVIQAGDDATGAELELAQAQVELRRASWRIQKSKDQVVPYLEQLEKRYKGIKLQ